MWKCSKCGTENDDSYDYCVVCGVEKNAPPSVAPVTQEPPQVQKEMTSVPAQSTVNSPSVESQPAVAPPTAPPPKILKIAIIQSPSPELVGRTLDLDFSIFQTISIGRNPENLLQMPDGSISRRHALIELKDDKFIIRDLQSTNGTYIFESGYFTKIEGDRNINVGDVIKLGEGTVIRVIQ
ncbi:MAG: FHA domain-containing protein [Thermoplasmata archaeon]